MAAVRGTRLTVSPAPSSPPPPEPEAARWAGREPSREVNGFTAMVVAVIGGVMYFCWAYLPETFAAVVTADAPNRYWAIAVPMHLCVTTAAILLCFVGHSLRINPGPGDLRAISEDPETLRNHADPSVVPAVLRPDSPVAAYRGVEGLAPGSRATVAAAAAVAEIPRVVPVLADIPLQRVNALLYGS